MLQPGQQFSRYKIIKLLGEGGMGCVYLAYHPTLKQNVALKILSFHTSFNSTQRFMQEAKITASLHHPNIVQVYDFAIENQIPYLVMQFINGKTLSQYVVEKRPSLPILIEIIVKVTEAVHYAHQQGILHRDIKPANIMINEQGIPYVMDFGLAKTIKNKEVSLTKEGQIIGTLKYMPPEQAQGESKKITRKSDIYSIGATLYYALTGRAPFEGSCEMNLLYQLTAENPICPNRRKYKLAIADWEKAMQLNPLAQHTLKTNIDRARKLLNKISKDQ